MLAAIAALALTADAQYVIATSLNLRAEAKANAKLTYVARIGETCTPKGAAVKGWVELDCGPFHGFAKAEFLSAEKPTLEAMKKKLDALGDLDDKGSWDERFTLVQRSIALGAPAASYQKFVEDYFLAMQRLSSDGEESVKPLKTVKPRISDDTQDAQAAGETDIQRQLGLGVKRFGYGSVLPDGTAWFFAGKYDANSPTWESYYQFHAIVTPGLATAFDEEMKADACPMTGSLCAAPACQTCKVQCAATCNECRLGCKLGKGWEKCVKACVPAYAACAAACGG